MSSHAIATEKQFPVSRSTSLQDVKRFAEEHKDRINEMTVTVNSSGIGDVVADDLEAAGFKVRRSRP